MTLLSIVRRDKFIIKCNYNYIFFPLIIIAIQIVIVMFLFTKKI